MRWRWPWSTPARPEVRRRPPIRMPDNVVPLYRTRAVEITIYVDGVLGRRFTLDPDEEREFIFANAHEGIALDRTADGTLWSVLPWSELPR